MSDRYSKSLLVDRNYSTSRFANGISASGLDTSAHKQETFRTQEPKKATKLKIPKLPLDSLLEEDSEGPSLNLSAICIDNTSGKKKSYESPKDESQELMMLLSHPQHKPYSRLDESSVIDPLSHILVENQANKENTTPSSNQLKTILKKQSQRFDKALLVLQANFNSYKEQSQSQISQLQNQVSSLKALVNSYSDNTQKMHSHLSAQIADAKDQAEEKLAKQQEELELKLQEQAKSNHNFTKQQLAQFQQEYEERSNRSRSVMQPRKPEQRQPSRAYQDLVKENRRLREELTFLWKDYGRNKLGLQFNKQ